MNDAHALHVEHDSGHAEECIERLRTAKEVGYATAVVDLSDLHVALAELERLRALSA